MKIALECVPGVAIGPSPGLETGWWIGPSLVGR